MPRPLTTEHTMETHYYHAGTRDGDSCIWSDHTRRSYDQAAREARSLARHHGGRPIVEWWDRSHGLRPNDCGAVIAAEYTD